LLEKGLLIEMCQLLELDEKKEDEAVEEEDELEFWN